MNIMVLIVSIMTSAFDQHRWCFPMTMATAARAVAIGPGVR